MIDAVADPIGSDSYDCTRVWGAWSYGTMGPDDFAPIAEDGDRVAEIARAAIAAQATLETDDELAHRITELEAQNAKFMQFVEWVKHAPVSSGVCCCGDDMAHADHRNHSAVDMRDHGLENWLRELG